MDALAFPVGNTGISDLHLAFDRFIFLGYRNRCWFGDHRAVDYKK